MIHFVNADLIAGGLSPHKPELAAIAAARVRQGGHDVPRLDVIRRFTRGWENFQNIQRPMADSWAVYENSDPPPQLLARAP